MRQPTKDQFTASLLGLCLADALGFPVEGYPPAICTRYVQQILMTGLAGQWKHYPYEFGQYSDDGQMARTVFESITHCEMFDPEDLANRLAHLFESKKIVGQGRSIQEAVQRLIHGLSWEKAGTLPPTAGNGSAMRSLAIGLFYYDNPEAMIKAARDQSWITHQDPRCLAGSIAIAGAVALAVTNAAIDDQAFINQLAEWTAPVSQAFVNQLNNLPEWLALDSREAAAVIARAGIEDSFQDNWHGISPFVTSSVLWSLYSFLKFKDDYWDVVCNAISAGGDTDTTAAMAGTVSAAYLGKNCLPSNLVSKLTDQGRWGLEQLTVLSERLYELKFENNSD